MGLPVGTVGQTRGRQPAHRSLTHFRASATTFRFPGIDNDDVIDHVIDTNDDHVAVRAAAGQEPINAQGRQSDAETGERHLLPAAVFRNRRPDDSDPVATTTPKTATTSAL